MSDYSNKLRKDVFLKFDGLCAYCGCELINGKFTIDHIIPKYKGIRTEDLNSMNITRGTSSIDNLNPCCGSCNSSKSTFTIEKWRREISLKFERSIKESSNLRLLVRMGMIQYNPDFKFYFEKIKRHG